MFFGRFTENFQKENHLRSFSCKQDWPKIINWWCPAHDVYAEASLRLDIKSET